MTKHDQQIGLDLPLKVEDAIEKDTLSRVSFAKSVVDSFSAISQSSGIVISVEGVWGSGKTSTLAMVEALLKKDQERLQPIIVHFNPWLIGDRDALLRHFLHRISNAVRLADHAKDAKKVARELKSYAKVFDAVKLIPGAEPWASILKSVFESVGESAGAISEYKTPDIEIQKQRVEAVLSTFARPIIVFIDDIDRLFPLEVFEMIRIVKAVGGLPNIGYVLAWDPAYASAALAAANVPQAASYLDKVVQVRLPLPNLSISARNKLINRALDEMHPEAVKSYFDGSDDNLSLLYFNGFRELLEQPRDVSRVFNTVKVIEPSLRGEIVFADIVGLSALMVKAAPVFELLRKHPSYFVGPLPNDVALPNKEAATVNSVGDKCTAAYESCALPNDVRRLVHFLFPHVAGSGDDFSVSRSLSVEGRISNPDRLLVALQRDISVGDVSLTAVRKFFRDPDFRESITDSLNVENCLEYLEIMGDVASTLKINEVSDLEKLCLAIAALISKEVFGNRARNRRDHFSQDAAVLAIRAIQATVKNLDASKFHVIADTIIRSRQAVCVAANVVAYSYLTSTEKQKNTLFAVDERKTEALLAFANNVVEANSSGEFFLLTEPGYVLKVLAQTLSSECPRVFQAMKSIDSDLDAFALAILHHSFDSNKGQVFGLPQEAECATAYCSLVELQDHAKARLADKLLAYPARAAWRALLENKRLYAVDGSDASWP